MSTYETVTLAFTFMVALSTLTYNLLGSPLRSFYPLQASPSRLLLRCPRETNGKTK